MESRDPWRDRWLIGSSYVAMLIPCLGFFVVAHKIFREPFVISLGIPVAGFVLLIIALTVGYTRYYGTSSMATGEKTLGRNGIVNVIGPFAMAACCLGLPALTLTSVAGRWIWQGKNPVLACWLLLVGMAFAIGHLVSVARISARLRR